MEQREIDFFCLIYIYIYFFSTSQCLSEAILRNTEYVLKINTSVRAKDQQQRKKTKQLCVICIYLNADQYQPECKLPQHLFWGQN